MHHIFPNYIMRTEQVMSMEMIYSSHFLSLFFNLNVKTNCIYYYPLSIFLGIIYNVLPGS